MFALLISLRGTAQVTPEMIAPIENGIVISNIETVEDATPAEIHDAIFKWIATAYKNPKHVVQIDTPSMVSIKGDGPLVGDPSVNLNYTVTVIFEIKDGRYKWTIKDIKISRPDLVSFEIPLKIKNQENEQEELNEIAKKFSPYVEPFQEIILNSCLEKW